MSKSGDRRQKKLALYFSSLSRRNKRSFIAEWDKRLQSWLQEVHLRGKLLGDGLAGEEVFVVLRHVNQLLELCDPEIEALVGRQTREALIHESCKVFSLAVSPQLYRIYNRKQYR